MKIDLTSIDLDAFADLEIWFVTIALMLAFAIFMFVRHDLKRLRITAPDPFFYPIRLRQGYGGQVGDVPNLPPLPQGSIMDGPAERSLTEAGTGYTPRELYLIERSAARAAPAGQGRGGDGTPYQGAAAAGPASPSSWRGRHVR